MMKIGTLLIVVAVFGSMLIGCNSPEGVDDNVGTSGIDTTTPLPSTTPTANEPVDSTPFPDGVLSPKDIDESMVNSYLSVAGTISHINHDPGGLALFLKDDTSQVGVRIENDTWESMSASERSEFKAGNTVTVEGMLVLTPTSELFLVVGVKPPTEGRPPPLLANVEIIAGPINISQQPNGSTGWPWPKIFLREGKIIVTYRGEYNGWPSQWLIESDDGFNWTTPLELPPGEVIINDSGAFTLSPFEYTDYNDRGVFGVVLNVLDDKYNLIKSITVDTRTCLHSADRGIFPEGIIDSKGNVHIVWAADTDIGTAVYYSVYDGIGLSEPIAVSRNPDMGSINQKIAIDNDGVVYVTYSETLEPWDPVTEGGYPDDFCTYLENGKWSEPLNISNTPDWGEYGMAIFAGENCMHTFYIPSRMTEPGQMRYVQISKDEIIREEIANFSFTDISMIFDGNQIHAVYGGWAYKNDYTGPDSELLLEGKVYYSFFDGENLVRWYGGRTTSPRLPG